MLCAVGTETLKFFCSAVLSTSISAFLLLSRFFLLLRRQRYLLSEAENHHQLFDLIEGMLEYEPSKRLALADSLKHPFFESGTISEAGSSKNWEGNRDISR